MESPKERVVIFSSEYKGIEHASTVVVCKNRPEFEYVKAWCIENGKSSPYLGYPKDYPFCIGTKEGSWTDSMNRALYYKPFEEFLADLRT